MWETGPGSGNSVIKGLKEPECESGNRPGGLRWVGCNPQVELKVQDQHSYVADLITNKYIGKQSQAAA